jgi:2-dehydro-3-deoxygluconokinase
LSYRPIDRQREGLPGLLTGEAPEQAVRRGWAHGALLTTFPGDTTMATVEQVRALAKGGSARIQR